jgi:glycerol-3-phosphate acyltransferase PlsY
VIRLVYVAAGYLVGLVQTAYILGRIMNTDLREHGSGNLGATNAFRVLGLKAGLITFSLDILKAIAVVLVIRYLFDGGAVGGLYGGLGVVLGHDFPFYLKFKGGKGVAVTTGIMLAISPVASLIIIAAMVLLIIITKYVSLGSISGMLIMAGYAAVKYRGNIEMTILIFALAALAIFMHRSNIIRLINGTENKIRK